MSSIDERIVEMQFKNSQFQRGAKNSLDALEKLKKGMDLKGAAKSLDTLNASGKKFNLGGIADNIDQIGVKFGAMQVLGVTALANIATKAIDAGATLIKSLTVDPVAQGLQEYETQLNAIQTIMANTESKGTTLDDVNGSLAELNEYADKTIYNFSEMTRNIGTFTAAGVDLDTSTNAIKGIANLAAVSGSNSQQASTAMYQLSQAMASGTVKLMDWNSVVNAGMGGQVFQDALTETARVGGVAIDEMIEKNGSFRESLQEGWLTTDILTDTLAKFTGELSKEQLKAQGYTEEQIKDIERLGEMATDAATKVKTGTQLIDVLKEAVGSGWAQTWQIVFGNFEEAKELWTGASDALTAIIGDASDTRNNLLQDWKRLGGRDQVITGIKAGFEALMTAIEPVKEAFQEIFPPATAMDLRQLSIDFRRFMENLKMGDETLEKVKSIFKGFFAALDIGRMIIVSAWETLSNLFGVATEGSGAILDSAAAFGDWIVSVRDALKKGEGITQFFGGLEKVLTVPIALVRALGDAIAWLWGRFFGGDEAGETIDNVADRMSERFSGLQNIANWLAGAWEKVVGAMQKVWEFIEPFASYLGNMFSTIVDNISNAFGEADFDQILDLVNTGLFAGLFLLAKKVVDNFGKGGADAIKGGGLVDAIKDVFGGLTDTLGAMQGQLKATTLLTIAGAVALLAGAVLVISTIDSGKLATALAGITAMFIQLLAAMAIFEKIGNSKGFLKMPFVAGSLILLSTAVLILSAAVKVMSTIEWQDMLVGLGGVIGLLGGLAGAANLMKGASAKLMLVAPALILVAVAVRILVGAVQDLSEMDPGSMAKGLAGVAALLTSLGIFAKLSAANKGGLLQGAGILLMAYGIKTLAEATIMLSDLGWEQIGKGIAALGGIFAAIAGFSAVTGNGANLILSATGILILSEALQTIVGVIGQFIEFSWEELGRGLAGMAGALAAVALALSLMPPTSILSAAAIFVAAQALGELMKAVQVGAGMEWEEIGKGLTLVGGAIGILALGLTLMSGALPGAAALLIASGALAILMPVIEQMGTLSWGQIGTGLGALAAALAIMAVAGYALIPAIPGLLGLGAALLLIGAGVALAGVGIMAFAAGIAALSVASVAGAGAIAALGKAIIGLIPMAMQALGEGIVLLAQVIGENAPILIQALVDLITALLEGIMEIAPVIIETVIGLIDMLLTALLENAPKFLDMGLELLTALLEGLADNIDEVVSAALKVVVGFLEGIADQIDDVVEAGGDVIVAFIEGITENVDDIIDAVTDLIVTFIDGVADSHDDILTAATNLVVTFINGLTDDLTAISEAATNFIVTLLGEMGNNLTEISEAVATFIGQFFDAMELQAQTIIDGGGDFIISLIEGMGTKATEIGAAASDTIADFLEGIDKALEKDIPRMQAAGRSIALNIADGMTGGLASKVASLGQQAANLAGTVLNRAKSVLGIASPSKEFIKIGEYVNEGFAKGLKSGQSKREVMDAYWDLNNMVKDGLADYREEIDKQEKQLKKLKEAKKKDKDAIKETEKALKDARAEYKLLQDTHSALVNNYDKERYRLYDLAEAYGRTTKKLEEATDALADAKDERDSFREGITDDNDNFSDFDSENESLSEYIERMKAQVEQTKVLRAGLDRLRDLGLNDKLYKQLAEGGLDSLPFVTELVDGGKGAVLAMNDINEDLDKVAGQLGKETSTELYQAGVDAAQGLVDGLKKKEKEITAEMEKIADSLVTAIKKKLDIKSPSRVFKQIGRYSAEGLALGLKDSAGMVTKATEDIGDQAITGLQQALADIGNSVSADLDLDPTIRPVIDLTAVKSGASEINGLMSAHQLDLAASADYASSTASAVRDTQDAEMAAVYGSGTNVTFNQYNSSPKALSEAEIYRQTNNQISKAKGALTT